MPLTRSDCILPDWPAPHGVQALVTTRSGGVSSGPYRSLNLGTSVGDKPEDVQRNRDLLTALLPAAPRWLRQVHGTRVVEAAAVDGLPEADAAVTAERGVVCTVQMADCMPVLLADIRGRRVGAAHAGWRGLSAGVLERTVAAMAVPEAELIAWLGPAIGPMHFEVGPDVLDAFTKGDAAAEQHFVPKSPGKWLADLPGLARRRLAALGVGRVFGGQWCTFTDDARFFSHRRDRITGRMAAMIWLDPAANR